MKRTIFWVMALFMLVAPLNAASKSKKKKKAPSAPIVQERAALIETSLTLSGPKYSFRGMETNDYKTLETIIAPIHDPLSLQLIKNAESRSSESLPFLIVGIGSQLSAVVDGASRYTIYSRSNVQQDYVFDILLFLGGTSVYIIGKGIEEQSKIDSFNAVKRYNSVVRGEVNISYNPQQQGAVLSWNGHF